MSDLFDLDFRRWDVILLSIIPAVINLGISAYVFFILEKSRMISYFSIFVLLLGMWQMEEGFMKMSKTMETAKEWYIISETFTLFVISFGVEFIVRFTKQYTKISAKLVFLFLFLPAIIFSVFVEARLDKFTIVKSSNWHWIGNPEATVITTIIFLWICQGALVMLALLWLYYFKTAKKSLPRKQALLLALGFTFPVTVGIVTEVIFPLALNYDDIPLTTPLLTVFSITALLAITKYKLFDYSPKHQWEKIIQSLNEGILIVDNKDCIMYANETFCKLFEYELSEIKGKIASDLFGNDNSKKEYIENMIAERKSNKVNQYEIELQTKTGKKLWMLISGSLYTNKRGDIIGSIGIHTNISKLKESNLELKTFIYKTSHDIRGPLASVIGLVNVSEMEIEDKVSLNYLKMIGSATQKLDHILGELVKAMYVSDVNVFVDSINFHQIMEEVLNKYHHYPGYSEVEISYKINFADEFISNKSVIVTVLQNLIENSIKYRNTELRAPFLNINITQLNNYIKIVIIDNGIGIHKSMQQNVFDMYFRGTDASNGSGLGLYLVKKGVEKLNGEIHLESDPAIGTTFSMLLPINGKI